MRACSEVRSTLSMLHPGTHRSAPYKRGMTGPSKHIPSKGRTFKRENPARHLSLYANDYRLIPNMALPQTFKALTYATSLPPSTPHVTRRPLTPPAPKTLLIKVHAAAANPVDLQLFNNTLMRWISQEEKGVGVDYAGEIVALGEGTSEQGWKVEERVCGLFARWVSIFPLVQ
jgi:hypothetical protein